MNTEKAFKFLLEHQPLPPTREMSKELLSEFDQIRRFFTANPDSRCIRPLLGAHGEGDGHGVYQVVDDCLRSHDSAIVTIEIERALRSNVPSVRMWAAEFASRYPNDSIVGALAQIVRADADETRRLAIMALNANKSARARSALNDLKANDPRIVVELADLQNSSS